MLSIDFNWPFFNKNFYWGFHAEYTTFKDISIDVAVTKSMHSIPDVAMSLKKKKKKKKIYIYK